GSPGARFALGVAIVQDLFIIVFLVFFPLLIHSRGDGGGFSIGRELGMLLIRGSVFLALAWVCARWGIPKLLQAVAKTRINELFTLAVIGCCVGLAWIGGLLQLSLALGAFVAGLAVSESVFKHRILADIMPVKDLFLTLFFVSVGLMVDVRLAIQFWPTILAITLLLIIGKTLVIFFIANRLGQQNRTALLAGFSLCSAGEFSLLLFQKAGEATLWSDAIQQCLVTSATLSMALVPGLMKLASPISAWLDHRGWGRQHVISEEPDSGPLLSDIMKHLEDHAVICGYGPVGQAINKALIDLGIPTLIIELNVETVQSLAKGGQPVLFADAAHHETWELARLSSARFVAFTIPDAEITAEALRLVREVNPEIGILARTRFSSDSGRLERHGASVILHDESEVARSAVEEAIRMSG
ncbi:MAG: cation:proton antiporter, partial [Verrucomicrobiota bacterium]